MRLVYLSPVRWASFAQRPHKFVSWFHHNTGADVLWIDPYPTRFPTLSDFQRMRDRSEEQNEANLNWVTVIKPSVLPVEPLPGSALLNAMMWGPLLRTIDEFARPGKCVLGIGKPSVLALAILKRLTGCQSVYDAMDDFPAFYSGLSRWAMCRREAQLARKVDSVLVSSSALEGKWRRAGANVQLVLNGLDAEGVPAFAGRPVAKGRKVLGYVGTIAAWFDWEWVIALAKSRPLDEVRLIGPVFCSLPADLPQNVRILPACNHREALAAMQQFAVGLIPFKKNDLTDSVDPIKYYEYRAFGLPVIATAFGEMALRDGETGVFLSEGVEDIAHLVDAALEHKTSVEVVQQFRTANAWTSRFSVLNPAQWKLDLASSHGDTHERLQPVPSSQTSQPAQLSQPPHSLQLRQDDDGGVGM